LTDEKEFPTSGVLFSTCQFGTGEDAPYGADDREYRQALPRREAGHRADLIRWSYQCTDSGIVTELLHQKAP
jgi:hypothetical protein